MKTGYAPTKRKVYLTQCKGECDLERDKCVSDFVVFVNIDKKVGSTHTHNGELSFEPLTFYVVPREAANQLYRSAVERDYARPLKTGDARKLADMAVEVTSEEMIPYLNAWHLMRWDRTGRIMASSQRSEGRSGATFRSHRLLPYPPRSVFEAFARPELLAHWWGPNGFTNTFEVFEFEPGGRWTFVMHGPDGSHHPNESVFLELDAPSRVVIQHVSQPRFVLTVTLAAHGAGTAITWTQEFEDSAVAARIRHIVEPANEQNLDRLLSVLAADR